MRLSIDKIATSTSDSGWRQRLFNTFQKRTEYQFIGPSCRIADNPILTPNENLHHNRTASAHSINSLLHIKTKSTKTFSPCTRISILNPNI